MTTKHIKTRLCVFALAILGLARAGLGQTMAEKTSEQDEFVLRNARGTIEGRLKFSRSPKTQQVDSLDYSGPPDVVADQKEDWTKWSRYDQLEAITLRMTTINKRLLEYISTLESVKELYCTGCIMEADALQALGKMKGLKEFHFDFLLGGKIPATDWKFLSGMENLEVLDLPGSRVNADFAKTFPHLRNLRKIRFGVDVKTASEIYPRLSELKKVREIDIDEFVLRNARGKIEGQLKFYRSPETQQVDDLEYSGPPDVVADQKEDWTKWSRYDQLETITLRMTTINKRLLEYISTLESVKELYCLGCIMEADALQPLGKMKRLEKFYFYLDLDGEFPATDWKFLSGMENLQALDVPGSRVNADFAKTFPHLRNLREIRISGVDEKTASEIYPRLSELKKVTEIRISVVRKRSAPPD